MVVAGADPYVRVSIGRQLPIIADKSFFWEYLQLFSEAERLQTKSLCGLIVTVNEKEFFGWK
jgi:hypothetical protein